MLLSTLWVLSLWAVTVVNYFAMRHINRCTKMLNLPGILANRKLRLLYVGFFGCAAVFDTVAFILQNFEDKDNKDDYNYRL